MNAKGQSITNGQSVNNGKDVFTMTWEQRELMTNMREDIYKYLEPMP